MTEEAVNKLTGLITPSGDMNVLSTADIVIEAVYENMEVKREIFQKLEKICKADAILATNTSYLSVDEVAGVTNRKGSVIGTRKSSHCVMNEYEWLECDLYAQFE
jgi:3-hydroxyacyl-CoA dehydrogenase